MGATLCVKTRRHSNMNWSYTLHRRKRIEVRKRTRNTPIRVFAILAAAPASVERPNDPASTAMTQKKIDQDNIVSLRLHLTISMLAARINPGCS